jgi:hypothetical protein
VQDDEIGRVSVKIKDLPPNQTVDEWYDVKAVEEEAEEAAPRSSFVKVRCL